MSAVNETFRALGDPTRRQIVEWLASGPPLTATALAARLPMTRQGVSRHLTALAEAGVVTSVRRGRETLYALQGDALAEADGWLQRRIASWDDALRRLADYLEG